MKNLFTILFILIGAPSILAQAEFTTWGNMTGIRVDNQLMEFNSSLVLMKSNWDNAWITRKEGQDIDFKRNQGIKTFSYQMDSINWKQTINDVEKGKAKRIQRHGSEKCHEDPQTSQTPKHWRPML